MGGETAWTHQGTGWTHPHAWRWVEQNLGRSTEVSPGFDPQPTATYHQTLHRAFLPASRASLISFTASTSPLTSSFEPFSGCVSRGPTVMNLLSSSMKSQFHSRLPISRAPSMPSAAAGGVTALVHDSGYGFHLQLLKSPRAPQLQQPRQRKLPWQ